MRRILPACRTGLTVAAALVVLSGCGASGGAGPTPTEGGPAAAGFRAVAPPEEIATDWHTLGDGVEQIATALRSTGVEDRGGRAALEEQVGQLQARVGPASTNVGAYLREECGIDARGSGPAAPSD
ncbi:MAG: hypothetical protein ACLGI3_07155 [Actinomycetes bacterium]